MRKTRLFIMLIAITITGCSWVPNVPIHIPVSRPAPTNYEAVLGTVHDLGYEVKSEDAKRSFVQLIANLDKGQTAMRGFMFGARAVSTTSLINISVKKTAVEITASGFHVRDDGTVMKVQLHDELNRLAQAIAKNLDSAVEVTTAQ